MNHSIHAATATHASALVWWWLLPAMMALMLITALLAWWWSSRRARHFDVIWVANTDHMEQTPEYRQAVRRYRGLRLAFVSLLAIVVITTGVIAARPVQIAKVPEQLRTRDIVLCLDTSGSMASYDGRIFEIFSDIVNQFQGERIGLSIFNSTSRTVFPLTDDYRLVQDQFAVGVEAFDKDPLTLDITGGTQEKDVLEYLSFTAGTLSSESGASLVGDGLANCLALFDHNEPNRSRSIILATDNFVSGEPIYTLAQAQQLVQESDVSLHGIWTDTDPSGLLGYSLGGEKEEFDRIISDGGGLVFEAEDPDVVSPMVGRIMDTEASTLEGTIQTTITDRPTGWWWLMVAVLGGFIIVAWRVRE